MAADPSNRTICVTGANGYLGAHVVRELLERGYRVKATVRDPADAGKTAHLTALPGADRLEFARADVLSDREWPAVLAEADALVHCATVVSFHAPDPQRDIVDVAVNGTRNVLGAAARSERTRSVVQMSSIAAIMSAGRPRDHVYTADDWESDATVHTNPYALGKRLSEKLAWDLAKPDADANRSGFRLVALNPGYVLGPLMARSHAHSSPRVVRDILRRRYPGCPPLNLNLVDVRDVATAAVNALEHAELSGRFPLIEGRYWWREIALELARHYPDRRLATRQLPAWLSYLNAMFDPAVSFAFLRRNLNRVWLIPGDAAASALGITYRGFERMVVDTARSMVEVGAVPR